VEARKWREIDDDDDSSSVVFYLHITHYYAYRKEVPVSIIGAATRTTMMRELETFVEYSKDSSVIPQKKRQTTCITMAFTPYQLLDRPMYHLCVKDEWQAAVDAGKAYFPPTFDQDKRKTHASMHADKLVGTANLFYKSSSPASTEWICIELDPKCLLETLGVVSLVESPEAVGDQAAETTSTIRYPHIYGGIATGVPGVVTNTFPMHAKRSNRWNFLGYSWIVTMMTTRLIFFDNPDRWVDGSLLWCRRTPNRNRVHAVSTFRVNSAAKYALLFGLTQLFLGRFIHSLPLPLKEYERNTSKLG
jgi:uncharacterized protein (DUF952 family)